MGTRRALAVARNARAGEDQAFIDAVSDRSDERGVGTPLPAARTMQVSCAFPVAHDNSFDATDSITFCADEREGGLKAGSIE
jgi:hypothetical protein